MKTQFFLVLFIVSCFYKISYEQALPDFTQAAFGLEKELGNKNVLVILWDPKRPTHMAPDKNAVDQLIFGSMNSVQRYFTENSGRKCTIQKAAILGWYAAKYPADFYWRSGKYNPNSLATNDPHLWIDKNGKYGQPGSKRYKDDEGFIGGHSHKWAEAIRSADADFNYSWYDSNGDQFLSPDELTVLVIIPQNGAYGTRRGVVGKHLPKEEALIVDGVRINQIVEAYIGNPMSMGLVAHELAHILFNADDMYYKGANNNDLFQPFSPGMYSLMDDSPRSPGHLDPVHKLKFGWLTPRPVQQNGWYDVKDIASSNEVLVLFDRNRGTKEYFLIENRYKGSSFNRNLPRQGLAIWHVIEEASVYKNSPTPPGVKPGDWTNSKLQNWGRKAVRMIRPIYGPPMNWNLWDGSNPLTGYDILANNTDPTKVTLRWADGSPTGFTISDIPPAGPNMRIRIGGVEKPKKPFNQVGGVGQLAEGAGVVLTDLDRNGQADMILMAYDAPKGRVNQFRYKVGKNMDAYGKADQWSSYIPVPGAGMLAEGASLAITDLDNNNIPDLIVMAYDAPEGRVNEFRYRVGKNLDAHGKAQSWSEVIRIPGMGQIAEGAGMAISDIDQNGRPDMVLMAYDAPPGRGNEFRYKVGANLDFNGITNQWGNMIRVPGVGQIGEGADIAIADFNGNGTPEIMLMAYDAPSGRDNEFRFKIGWELKIDGRTAHPWPQFWNQVKGVGTLAEGAGLDLYDIDHDGFPEAIFMAYDAPKNRMNEFRYLVVNKERLYVH